MSRLSDRRSAVGFLTVVLTTRFVLSLNIYTHTFIKTMLRVRTLDDIQEMNALIVGHDHLS